MSFLSKAGRAVADFSTFGQSEPAFRMTGAGQTGDPSQPQFTTQSDNPTLSDALQRIQQASQYGTYGEGSVSQAVKEFQNLESQLQSGKISQKDYVAAASGLQQQLQPYLSSLYNGGSAAASAAKAAGGDNLISNYFRNADIYKSAQDMLGRDLTADEFAQLAPLFGSGSQKELEAGRAALAQIAENDKNSPTGIAQKYQQGASGYNDQVNGIFQSLLNRGATSDELNHFGTLLASGQVDPYTLGQFVQQLPEYQDAQDAKERASLNTELSGYDQDFFNKAKEDVISRYAKAGIQNSPSLDFALTNLMGQIQNNRSQYLAGLSRQDFQNNQANARQDYTTAMNQMLSNNANNYARGNQLQDALTGRSYDVADYQTQRNDLMNLLSQQQQRRQSNIGGAVGGLIGAGIGAIYHNPTAGYQIGSSAGGLYDYYNQ